MKKTILSIILLFSTLLSANAQRELRVHLADGTTKTWKAWEVDFIDFIDEDPLPATKPDASVDLGLSVLWSPVNLGAEKSAQVGNYYGWGEITGLNKSTNLKYYPYTGISENILGTSYDMATAAWGDLWRLPSRSEFQELIDNCDWEAAEGGYNLTSKVNGASLFLPYVYYREGDKVNSDFAGLLYWSGDIAEDNQKATCFRSTRSSENAVDSIVIVKKDTIISSEDKRNFQDLYDDNIIGSSKNEDGSWTFNLELKDTIKVYQNVPEIYEMYRYMGLAVRPVYGKVKKQFNITVEKVSTTFDQATVSASLVNPEDVVGYGIKVAKDEAELLAGGKNCINVEKDRKVNGQDVDNPVFEVTNLESKTNYYFQLYAFSASNDTVMTDVNTFVTEEAKFQNEYVDLGTGILWAKFNVGAESIYQQGEYYAWGDLEPKTTYSPATYNLTFDIPITGNSDENTLTLPIDVLKRKVGNVDGYMISSVEKYPDISGTKYDVAKAKWGGKWRMPTKEEWKKLSQYCNWEFVTIPGTYNKKGFKVSSKIDSSKYIYLPAGGIKKYSTVSGDNTTANYWSSTLWTYSEAIYYGQKVFDMMCESTDISNRNFADYTDRYYGCLVRPVMDK